MSGLLTLPKGCWDWLDRTQHSLQEIAHQLQRIANLLESDLARKEEKE